MATNHVSAPEDYPTNQGPRIVDTGDINRSNLTGFRNPVPDT